MAPRRGIVAAGTAVTAALLARWCRGRSGWRWVADPPLAVARRSHEAVLLHDGRVLVAGGADGDTVLASAEVRAPDGEWSATAPLGTPRVRAASVRLSDGRVLVVGGWTGAAATGSAEVWDPATGTWSAIGTMAHPRIGHAAVLLADGRVLVAGGGAPGGAFPAHAERYDPLTGTWSVVGPLSLGRQSLSLTRLPDGTVLAAGGDAGGAGVTTCDRYDPATASWSLTGPLSTGRSDDDAGGFTATLLGDGRVLVACGVQSGGGVTYLDSAEAYAAALGTWSPLPALPGSGRVLPAAATLDDGSGLVVGGWTGDVALADAARIDPDTDTWDVLPSLATPRGGHTATTLADGDVLVVGGFTPHLGGVSATVERLVRRGGCCPGPFRR